MEKREIKFRAWDHFNGVMIKPEDVNGNKKDLSWFFSQVEESVKGGNAMSVMQYIGQNDIVGNGIYDGDIVLSQNLKNEDKTPGLCVVYWNVNAWYIRSVWTGGTTGLYMAHEAFGVTVIGNIHQHPHLLK